MATMRFPQVSNKSLRAMAIKIRNEMSGGRATDDSRFSIRHIEAEIRHQYGIVQKDLDRENELLDRYPDQNRVQIYACLPLVETTDFYCNCTKSGASFKKVKLPTFYEWKGQPFIQYLGTTDVMTPFIALDSMSAISSYGDSLTKPSFFVANGNAYIYLPKKYALICEVTVMGIPQDPTETTGRCFDVWNEKWNVSDYVKGLVEDRIRRSFVNLMLTTASNADIVNNAQHGNQN